ncbi:MAG: antibiotic biosynthesis monooxygenase [Rhodocyclaceae bacterium]|nr:antibiotic biosynthesis monooxygenase [Rhodocyclaceae bacterium]MBX3668793.1 antibiotic biosynthesis monooxygenase [Rhodocyclaceae bacterium]
MSQIVVVAKITAQPESAAALEHAMGVLVQASRSEAGCVAYDLYKHAELAGEFVFVETWHDRAALEAHWQAPHMQAYRQIAGPLIAARDVKVLPLPEQA